jgi:SAM-dependent methyltransferase
LTIKSKNRPDVGRRVYLRMMDNQGVLNQKVSDIAGLCKPGLVLDHGSSSGHLINEIQNIFSDSKCVGIDVSPDMVDLARSNFNEINFVQGDILDNIYADGEVDTIICSSTLHEVWSEHINQGQSGFDAIKKYFSVVKKQLGSDGVFIIRGVGDFGEYSPDKVVDVEMVDDDGLDFHGADDTPADLLSTRGRFEKFSKDFVQSIDYCLLKNGRVRTTLQNIWEFALTKDYTNVWELEMTEEFCGFGLSDVKESLTDAGFDVEFSRSYTNPWVKSNRLRNKVDLYHKDTNDKIDYPPTNFVIQAS